MTSILVFVEHRDGTPRRASLEALGAAAATGLAPIALVTGPGAAQAAAPLSAAGAKKLVVITGGDHYSPDGTAADIAAAVGAHAAVAFVAAASSAGKDLLGRVAGLLDCAPLADCTTFTCSGGVFTVQRPILAGKALVTVQSQSKVCCATLRSNTFAVATGGGAAEVTTVATKGGKVKVTGVAAKGDAKLDVKEAAVVVSGGRGLREAAGFKIVEDLAAAFGNAAVGASRAVVDSHWRPHSEQVGQTGKTVAPQLYVAVGISGAIQHLAGMRTSKVIVAINKDAAAPIFKVADYGIVGDAFEVLPALTEAVKQAKAAN
ncbi:MAG: electron transfer flavoprotein subunit alpha/FixB family protein [Planctomycetes bacterium]|nr:electron transfer flavoprotein subunit alpha/FixB family protein [Planctomycetota bacterium]